MFHNSLIHPLFAAITALAALVIIPRRLYKHYFLYALIFGGLGDSAIAFLLTKAHLIKYKGMGPFNVFNIFSAWTPLTWIFTYMVFLFFLPFRKIFLPFYILAFTMFNYIVGLVLQNLGLFEYIGIEKYLSPLIFAGWLSSAAWIYYKNERIALK